VSTATDAAALSTAPTPVGPQTGPAGGGPLRRMAVALRRGWRQLTSMRTALLLLFLLALGAVPGTVLPQRGLNPSQVSAYYTAHPGLAPVLDRLGLFNVFGSAWYAAIYLLLFVSLVGCLLPRARLHLRAMRARPPRAPANLTRLPSSASWLSAAEPEAVLAGAAALLRRGRWRVDRAPGAVAAERGYLRETGNLLFHCSLVVLLVGIGIGSLFGFQADKALVSGGPPFVSGAFDYDTYAPGRLTAASSLQPFVIGLDRFTATYQPDGTPRTFDAYVTARASPSAPARLVDLSVNHPLSYGSTNVYLIGHGYALNVSVTNRAGTPVYQDTVLCIPQNLVNYLSTCVIKVPDTDATVSSRTLGRVPLQFGVVAVLAPTAELSLTQGLVSSFPSLQRPRVALSAFTGDLGLNRGVPQDVYTLSTAGMTEVAAGLLTPGGSGTAPAEPSTASLRGSGLSDGSIRLSDGFVLHVNGVTNWVSLQVKDDPGKQIALVAAVLIVLGLLLSLRVRRRRLWVRADGADGGHTLVSVGGLARSDTDGFAASFPELVARLQAVAPPLQPDADPPARTETEE
jgi:cytochrome c biogenesis protein